MLFKIIKKAPNSFWHLYNNGSKEVNLSDFEVVLDLIAQTFNIQCLNGANIPNQSVEIANIRVIDQTDGSLEETFANVIALKNRLTTLGYTPYKSSTGIEEAPVDGNTYGRKDEGWIIITGGSGTQTLAEVLAEGNTTGGENIVINNADSIELENTSSLKKGTYNFGGNGGISRICSNNYEDMWQNGFRHVFDQSGFIRNSTNCFDIIPDETFDDTLRFKVDSLWTLDNGTSYICTDATTGAAVWELANQISLQQVLDNNHDLVDNNNFQGTDAGYNNTGTDVNAFGFEAAIDNSGTFVNAFGTSSASNNSGLNINAIGQGAGVDNTFNNVNLLGENATANEDGQTVLSKDGIIMARISTTELTDTRKYNLPDASGTLALTSDITTPTLQEVLIEGDRPIKEINTNYSFEDADRGKYLLITDTADLTLNADILASDSELLIKNSGGGIVDVNLVVGTGVTVYLNNTDGSAGAVFPIEQGNIFILKQNGNTNIWYLSIISSSLDSTTPTLQEVTDEGNETTNRIIVIESDVTSITINNNNIERVEYDLNASTQLTFQNSENNNNIIAFPDASGTLALTSDIPSSSGIPHATASGTDTYTATITGVAAYTDADAYLIRFTNGNTTGATLNINSLGAKTLYRNNDGALIGGDIINGGEMLCIYNTSLNGFQVIGTAPNSLFAYITNDDSVTLTKGMPVYAFSGTGDRMTVKRANNSTDATSAQTVGLVLSTSIAAGQKGLIMMQGLLDGLSILPTATFADGDAVYLGATDGSITNVKPYAPNHLVYLGVVTTASNGSAGRMYVRVQNGYELSEIHDVDLITNAPTNNQALTYESSTDLWKNKTIIEDSITNGVTDKAPSQNAVFDALALKQDTLPAATTSVDGYLTATDWNTFNQKCYAINLGATSTTYLANNTYYFGIPTFAATSASAQRKILIPKTGTIKGGQIYIRTSVGTTSENWTLSIRLNNTTNTTFATVGTTALEKIFGTTSLNISVVAGDFIEIITSTPAWVTGPGSSFIYGTIIIQ